MRAIELEATVEHHTIRLPETIPDGTHLRVLLLMDDPPRPANDGGDLKGLLAGLTEGLTAEDLHRKPWSVPEGPSLVFPALPRVLEPAKHADYTNNY